METAISYSDQSPVTQGDPQSMAKSMRKYSLDTVHGTVPVRSL